jgi:hypothetical protein
VGNVAYGKGEIHTEFSLPDDMEDLSVGGSILLECILKI